MPTLAQIGSPEYQAELRRQAEASLAATRDLALNQIGLGEQGLAQQENTIKQQNALANQNLDLNQTDIQRQYDALGKQLQDEAVKSRGYLTENFNNLGLLQSGLTAAGLGDIQKTLVKGQTESEQDRASRLASIALQRAGLTTAMQSDLSNIGLQRAGLGLKRTEVQQGYSKDVSDYVNQLLQQQYATEQARLDAIKASQSSGGGSAVSSVLAQLLGAGGQQAQGAIQTPDLGQYFKKLFDAGQFINGTEDFARALDKADTIGGAPNPYKGLGLDNILRVAYDIRKPYEKNPPSITGIQGYVSPTKYLGMRG